MGRGTPQGLGKAWQKASAADINVRRLGRRAAHVLIANTPSAFEPRPAPALARTAAVLCLGSTGIFLLVWGVSALLLGVLFVPARRGGALLGGLSVYPLASGLLLWALCVLAWVVDHFDTRPNEASYARFYAFTGRAGAFLAGGGFALALLVSLTHPGAGGPPPGTGTHIFYPAVAAALEPLGFVASDALFLTSIALFVASAVLIKLLQKSTYERAKLAAALVGMAAMAWLLFALALAGYNDGMQRAAAGRSNELSARSAWVVSFTLIGLGILSVVIGAAIGLYGRFAGWQLRIDSPSPRRDASPPFRARYAAARHARSSPAAGSWFWIVFAPLLLVVLALTAGHRLFDAVSTLTAGEPLVVGRVGRRASTPVLVGWGGAWAHLTALFLILLGAGLGIVQGLRRSTFFGWHSLLVVLGVVLLLFAPALATLRGTVTLVAVVAVLAAYAWIRRRLWPG